MADDDQSTAGTDYRQYAGRVAFPRTPEDLRSTTQCPACFAPLSATVCSNCGLDLANPTAARLAEISNGVADLLDHRLDLIGRIRFDTSHPAAAAAAEPEVAVAAASVPASAVVAEPAPAAVAPPAPVVAEAAPAPAPPLEPPTAAPVPAPAAASAPRRSSVQVVLLIVGISLLSIAAIFFLVYAFITFGLIARSLIIGGITVAAFVVASLLKRRGLSATGEGIAAFGVVLVYLDAFALRANDFFGLSEVDALPYWGWTLVITAVGFVLWSRLTGLRVPSVAGFAAVVPGVALVAAWLSRDTGGLEPVFWTFAAAATAALVHGLAARRDRPASTERVILLSFGLLSILLAGGFAFAVGEGTDGLGMVAVLGIAAVAAVHVLILARGATRGGIATVFGVAYAALAGVTAAIAPLSLAVRVDQVAVTALVPIVVATAFALLFEFAGRRVPRPLGSYATVAAWAAGVIAAVAALIAAGSLVVRAFSSAFGGLVTAWNARPDDRLDFSDGLVFGALGLVVALGMTALAWAASGTLRRRAPALIWAGAILLVLAVPLLSVLWAIVAGWLLIASGAVAALIALRRRSSRAHRAPLVTIAVSGGALGWLAAWASTSTWLPATVVLIALLLALRVTVSGTVGRAVLFGASTVPLLIGAGAGARLLAMPLDPHPATDFVNTVRAIGGVAILMLGAAAIVRGGPVTTADRRTAFWIALPVSGVTAILAQTTLALSDPFNPRGLLLPEYAASLVASVLLLAGLVAWSAAPRNAPLRGERVVASLAIGASVFWVVDSLVRLVGFADYVVSLAPIAAALLAAAGALAISVLRPATTARWAREAGVGVVAVPAILSALSFRLDSAWLALLLGAVTALVLAISADGLFGSASRRKHFGWAALALGAAALWYRLAENRVGEIEPYVLPIAGTLLTVALLIWRSARRRGQDSRSAAPLALAGALVAILPLAITAASGSIVRPLLVGGVSAALLLLGSLLVGNAKLRPYLDASALTGVLGVLIVGVGRAVSVTAEPGEADLRLDAWLVAMVLVLAIAAFGQARERSDSSAALRRTTSQVLAVVALVALLALELPSFGSGELAPPRATAVLLLLAAVHVIAFVVDRPPLGRAISWVAIVLAAVTAIAGVTTGALEWVELGTVPLALALLVSGGIHLAATPTARSWAWLAPGTAVLLVPSLIATFVDAPLWRLAALGIVGVGILVASTLLRLQAPFLISAVVVLIHAIRTFAPQIRFIYESVEWWLWLAIGGAIIVAVAAMFERSKRGFTRVAMTLRALR